MRSTGSLNPPSLKEESLIPSAISTPSSGDDGARNYRSYRSLVNGFLKNIVEVYRLDYGEYYALEKNANQLIFNHTRSVFQEEIKFQNQLNDVLRTSKPKLLSFPISGYLSEKSVNGNQYVAYPLIYNQKPLGVLVLGGQKNGVPTTFDGMGLNEIQNLSSVLAKAIYLDHYSYESYQDALINYKDLIIDLYSHDHKIGAHSNKIALLSERVVKEHGGSDNVINHVKQSAYLHDIGKLFIPKKILNKPGPLTLEEWDVMKRHPEIGSQIVSLTTGMHTVADVVCTHHEHYDGTGYPYGLKGESIPLAARILSVVDAYGAMTEKRVYQRPKTAEEAFSELARCSGTHFDPVVVKSFIHVMSN